jgi:hypothetical protein
MSLAAIVLAASALPVLELELRWVEQTVQASTPGARVLSTQAGARITPLGPVMRVQAGRTAQWSLQLEGQAMWLQQRQGGAKVVLQTGAGRRAWHLEATPQWRGERQPIQLQLHWQQPADEAGASQSWRSTLPVRAGHWVTVSRQPSASAATAEPAGTLSTRPLAQVRELQVRVSPVLE